jgi:hypothetical protein
MIWKILVSCFLALSLSSLCRAARVSVLDDTNKTNKTIESLSSSLSKASEDKVFSANEYDEKNPIIKDLVTAVDNEVISEQFLIDLFAWLLVDAHNDRQRVSHSKRLTLKRRNTFIKKKCANYLNSLGEGSGEDEEDSLAASNWTCEFNSVRLDKSDHFCTCSREYDCAENEQYFFSLDPDEYELLRKEKEEEEKKVMDDEVVFRRSPSSSSASRFKRNSRSFLLKIEAKCGLEMKQFTGADWTCKFDTQQFFKRTTTPPTTQDSDLHCECFTQRKCLYNKILSFKEFM